MYGLTLDGPFLALQVGQLPDVANFTLEKLCPYMTQPIEVYLYPDEKQIPVVSWQLARQLDKERKNHPELNAFRFQRLETDAGWPVPKIINDFAGELPGRLLLLTANLRRGLGDMVLLQPIFRAQAKRLQELGWPEKISLSGSRDFACLYDRQPFIDDYLPECPGLQDIMRFDYVIEYGLKLERMQHFIGISDWHEIDLEVRLSVSPDRVRHWQRIISPDFPRIFANWASFDQKRSLSPSVFQAIKKAFPQIALFTSIHNNPNAGEVFPDGPQNLWPLQKDLADLLAILANMDIVITTNTGVAHVAAGLGKPTIVVFSGRLYGWGHYWPHLYPELYPTMHPIGLDEGLSLTEENIQKQILAKLEDFLSREKGKEK